MLSFMLFAAWGFSQITAEEVLVGNGGQYGNEADHVSLTSINPDDYSSSFVGEIIRESIQDMVIDGQYAYLAAEDSIAKFDLIAKTKVAQVYESNLSRLAFVNNQLLVSRRSDINGPPADGIYLKAYDADLNFISQAEGIPTDASDIAVVNDSIYLAIPGDWQATEGQMAIISADFSFMRILNLGASAVGLYDLFYDNNKIYTVNKTPYGLTVGSVSTYDIETATYTTQVIENVVGKGVYLKDDILYLGLDYGIGSYNISSNEVINNQIVPDPGSATYISIAGAAYDYINEHIYVSITDYFSFGQGKVYDLEGNEIAAFEAGISAEAIKVRYKDHTLVPELAATSVKTYPNPCRDFITIQSQNPILSVRIISQLGQEISHTAASGEIQKRVDLHRLKNGLYILQIESTQGIVTKSILKQ